MTQAEALDVLKLGYNVFLTGPPGSGKTFLLNQYIRHLKNCQRGVAITASTGIAATHLEGVTIHSWSGLGIKEELSQMDFQKLLKKSYLKKRFRQTGVLIIDEISMLHAFQLDLVNLICQTFKNSIRPFGGMQLVCSGDFFQLPPVQKNGASKFVTDSEIWQTMNMKICYLEEQYRQEESGVLFALLNHIRNNEVDECRGLLANRKWEEKPYSTKLYTHNIDVDAINNFELTKIAGKEFSYQMETEGKKNIAAALKSSCLAPERLRLKKGAKAMFVKNNFEKGYVNGTLGEVVGFDAGDLPVIKIANGREIVAAPASWTIEENGVVRARITQIPLRLAWAITVHKSQGMNLDAAEIDLSKSFVEGMGYVALSRLRSLEGLKLMGINDLALEVNQEILALDKELRRQSRAVAEDLGKIETVEKKEKYKEFLRSLPMIEPGKKHKASDDLTGLWSQEKRKQKKEKSFLSPKNHQCQTCGRSIRHQGNCLPCNIAAKNL